MTQRLALTLTASELALLKNAIWLRPRLMQHLNVASTLDDSHFTLDVDTACVEEYLEDAAAEWVRAGAAGTEDHRPMLRALIDKLTTL